MDRRLFLATVAASAWGQQASPATTDAEKALRSRVEQFYQLEVDGANGAPSAFRKAEALVAEESKDYFYNANKPKLENFTYTSAVFSDNNTRAKVTVKVKTEVFFPGVGPQVFETPLISDWKLESGEWCWYFDKDAALNTPFGRMNPGPGGVGSNSVPQMPSMAALESQVTISKTSVALNDNNPLQFVTITNHMAGPVGVSVTATRLDGVTVDLEKNEIASDATIGVRLRLTEKGKKGAGTVEITCSPLGQHFEVQVTAN